MPDTIKTKPAAHAGFEMPPAKPEWTRRVGRLGGWYYRHGSRAAPAEADAPMDSTDARGRDGTRAPQSWQRPAV